MSLLIRPHLLCVLALGLVGCPSPSIYGTARTTPVGQFSNTISVEGVAFQNEVVEADGRVHEQLQPLPSLPTYQLRYGAWESTDLGFRWAHGGNLGVDVKHTFLKGAVIDLAVDPMLQAAWIPGGWGSPSYGIWYAHLPAIIDFNLSDSATLLLTPGVMYAGAEEAADIAGLFARAGLGLNARLSDGFAVQPEVTALKLLSNQGETPLLIMGNIAFNFGALPKQP